MAARFDTTPSELSKLNRLGSTFIYSGQQLWVPNKGEGRSGGGTTATDAPSPDPPQDHDSQDDLPPEEKGTLNNETFFFFISFYLTFFPFLFSLPFETSHRTVQIKCYEFFFYQLVSSINFLFLFFLVFTVYFLFLFLIFKRYIQGNQIICYELIFFFGSIHRWFFLGTLHRVVQTYFDEFCFVFNYMYIYRSFFRNI